MKRTIIQCDRCGKNYGIPQSMGDDEWYHLSSGWITLVHAPLSDRHYCSQACLSKSLGMYPVAPTEAPQSKMRRFLLVDGETADELEGVLFSSGVVSVNVGKDKTAILYFRNWDDLRERLPGSGITWIDQEVSGE